MSEARSKIPQRQRDRLVALCAAMVIMAASVGGIVAARAGDWVGVVREGVVIVFVLLVWRQIVKPSGRILWGMGALATLYLVLTIEIHAGVLF